MIGQIIITVALAAAVLGLFFRMLRIVPEEEAWLIENFGKYKRTLGPGLHLVVPVVQRVAYEQMLKEEAIDVPPQICITKDNVQVSVDGILYLKVFDAYKASYGTEDYRFATAQLAQTTMRSEIGKIELDRTFSERDAINDAIVAAVDEASDPWGIKVTRYEIKDITPTETVVQAMEQQVRAEREKRAEIIASDGDRASRIALSEGQRTEAVNLSQGERTRRVNEAEGRAKAIELVSEATAEGIREVARAINTPAGRSAVSLRIAQQFIAQLGDILDRVEIDVLPTDLAQIRSLMRVIRGDDEQADSAGNTGAGSVAGQTTRRAN